jgi:acetolactate synthase-1/2/3 large subunit
MLTGWEKDSDAGHRDGRISLTIQSFAQALEGRPGPVFLELPLDIVGVSVPEKAAPMPTRATPKFNTHPDDVDLKRAAEIINAAQKPLFLGGSGVTFSDCEVALKAFLEKTGIPFQLHNYGRGVVPDTHPLSLMDAGFTGLMLALSQADVIIAAGIRFNWIFQSGQAISPQAKIVRIDIEPTEINRNRVAAAGLVGDVGSVLNQLLPFVQKRDHSAWINTLRRAYLAFIDTELKLREKLSDPIHPIRLVEQIQKAMGDNTLFVADGGDTSYWAFAGFRATEKAGMVVGSGGLFGCLGTGIPFAIAAKLARPDKKVLLLNGDGSFGLNAMEFDTAVRHNIPFVCVVNNDCSWGMVKHDQELSMGKECLSCVSLPLIHYEKMVEGLGGHGEFVTKDEEIIPAIQRALKSDKPACVNVITDPTAVSPASLAFYVSLKVD